MVSSDCSVRTGWILQIGEGKCRYSIQTDAFIDPCEMDKGHGDKDMKSRCERHWEERSHTHDDGSACHTQQRRVA